MNQEDFIKNRNMTVEKLETEIAKLTRRCQNCGDLLGQLSCLYATKGGLFGYLKERNVRFTEYFPASTGLFIHDDDGFLDAILYLGGVPYDFTIYYEELGGFIEPVDAVLYIVKKLHNDPQVREFCGKMAVSEATKTSERQLDQESTDQAGNRQ